MKLGRWAARAALLLFPREWRDRYGEEVEALAAEGRPGAALVDLVAVWLRRDYATPAEGGMPVVARRTMWLWLAAGAAAVLLAAPTAGFLLLNLAPGPLESLTGVEIPLGVGVVPEVAWVLPGLPFLALLAAIGPALRVAVRRGDDGGVGVFVRLLPLPQAAVVVAALCALLVAVVVVYGVSENVLEGLR